MSNYESILDVLTTESERRDGMKKELVPTGCSGPHEIGVCQLCGWAEWRRSRGKGEETVELVPLEGCDRCSVVYRRSPEIFAWAQGIALTLARLMKEVRDEKNRAVPGQ